MTTPDPPSSDTEPQALQPPVLDPDKYRHHLAEFEMSVEEQNEFLAVLWRILCTCVDIGVGLDSVQLLFRGKTPAQGDLSGADSENSVQMEEHQKHFNRIASTHASKEDQQNEGST